MKKILLFAGIFTVISALTIRAQVTVGTNELPVPGAILQLKTINDAASNGNVNATQGLGLPRVALVVKDQLQPMYSASEAPNLSNVVKMNHRGLVVYNVTENADEELYPGLYQWDGKQWTGLEQKTTAAVITFPTNCNAIAVYGDYFNNSPLNSSNYITIPVNVTRAGYYTISIVPNPDNGYYFTTSGSFMTTGPVIVTIPGAGQPKNFTPTGNPGDALTVVCNEDTAACSPYVFVEDGTHKPYFAMACGSVTVNGVYEKGILPPTPNTETITLHLNVYDGAQGAPWSAKTDVIDGLWFEGSGTLGAAGTQDIVLYAQGASTNASAKIFTITTNSQSTSATCSATVTPIIAAKRVIAYGDTGYGFMSPAGTNAIGCYAMVTDSMNYGTNPNSFVKFEGFAALEGQDHPVGTDYVNLPNDLASVTAKGTGYDIIIISFPAHISNQSQIDSLTSFVNRGGVLIVLDQNQDVLDLNLINSIFGEAPFSTYADGAVWISSDLTIGTASLIRMNSNVDDMISNGPFGNVGGTQWGDDSAGSTTGLLATPRGAIVYAGATGASNNIPNVNSAQVTILRHPTKNFFWCGDGGLIASNGASTITVTTAFPFKIASRTVNSIVYPNFPFQELYGSSNTTYRKLPVCNSTLFANVMAWALKMAEENGINSGQ